MKNYLKIFAFYILSCTDAFSQCPTLSMSGSGVSCYGGLNGTAQVTITPAIPPSGSYIITWSNGGTGTSISGLVAGTYTVNVKNTGSGCTVNGVYTVNTPDPIAVSEVISNVNCFGQSTGQINITPIGGTSPYQYSWSNDGTGDGFTDPQDVIGLPSGNHTVIVRDVNLCTQSRTYNVTQPTSALGLSSVKTNVACFGGATGSIDLSPYGGTPPYQYSWSNGAITQDISNLSVGNYAITVTDNKGCQINASIPITQPSQPLSAVPSTTNVNCFGENTGQAGVTISGGTVPYSYSWSNSTFVFSQNSAVLQNIPSDVYSVTVTDSKGCVLVENGLIVNSPAALIVLDTTIVNVKCHGDASGSIDVVVGGGSFPYFYSWSNSATSEDLTGIPYGTYTLTITDNNGCIKTESYFVNEPTSPLSIITNNVTDVLCYNMNTGSINIIASGGTPNYSYLWSNLSTSEDLNNLFSDNYNVVVTDANLCTANANFFVDQPQDTLIATNIITNVNCFGESNGSVNINTTGGTAPYSYEWTNSTYQLSVSTEDLIGYPSDSYSLTITDQHNCIFEESFTITQPNLLTGTISGTNILCKNENTGAIDVTIEPFAGTAPYQFNWNNLVITEDQSGLYADTYSVVVSDAHFCEFELSIILTEPEDSLSFEFVSNKVICYGEDNGSIVLIPNGGTPNYIFDWSSGDNTSTINNLTAGWYVFVITDNNNCTLTDSIEVVQPDLLLANEVVIDASCNGYSDGSIDITPTGGNGFYNYTWFNSLFALSSQEQDLIGFPSEVYQLELRDTLGCLTELFIEIGEPDVLSLTLGSVNVVCAGGTNGSIDLTVEGGTPNYYYLWSNGATSEDLFNIPVDEYTVVVTDAQNCIDSTSIVIYEPDSIQIVFSTTEVSCVDQLDGTVFAIPSGGTGDFTYEWSNTATSALIENLVGGDYSVTVMDIVGCTASANTFVPTNLQACIYPPNAFSPNGDNYNDTWYFDNAEVYPDAEMQIFNRLGNLIHSQKGVYDPWDGKVHGAEAPSDTYYFIFNLNKPNRKPVIGNITIVR